MNMLHAPIGGLFGAAIFDSRVHEFDAEPIEQGRMSRFGSAETKIFGRLDEASAEVALPDSIHANSRCCGRFFVDQPMSESEAAVIRIGGQGMEEGRHTGFNFFAWLKPIAALEHVRRAAFFIWPLAFAGEQDRGGSAFGPLFPKRGDF